MVQMIIKNLDGDTLKSTIFESEKYFNYSMNSYRDTLSINCNSDDSVVATLKEIFDFLRDYSEIFKVQVVVDNVVKIEQSYSLSVDTIAFDIYLGGNAKLSFIKSYNPMVKG